jgi:hypothetical protein
MARVRDFLLLLLTLLQNQSLTLLTFVLPPRAAETVTSC